MKWLIRFSRYFVGILFIFSGLVKANDPLGLSYKMQEFFEVWNIHSMNDYTLTFSVIIIAFEIIAGIALIIGWQMRWISWLLLLLIIFFTFLTGYALFSGKFKSCGCFGECIPITPNQSFAKDLILLVLTGLIVWKYQMLQPWFRRRWQLFVMVNAVVFSFGFQVYVLYYLPVYDCLPFKAGNNIAEKMKIPPDAIPDSTVITFVYLKDGKEIEFTSTNFPEDFDDTVYEFVRRYDKLIRKGNAEPVIKDLAFRNADGADMTSMILEKPGKVALLFLKEMDGMQKTWENEFNSLSKDLKINGYDLYVITASYDEVNRFINQKHQLDIQILKCDATVIKTAARAIPVLYLLNDGTVMKKYSGLEFDKVKVQ